MPEPIKIQCCEAWKPLLSRAILVANALWAAISSGLWRPQDPQAILFEYYLLYWLFLKFFLHLNYNSSEYVLCGTSVTCVLATCTLYMSGCEPKRQARRLTNTDFPVLNPITTATAFCKSTLDTNVANAEILAESFQVEAVSSTKHRRGHVIHNSATYSALGN